MSCIVLLALDPSTDVTGAAVLQVPERGDVRLLGYTAKNANKAEGVSRGTDISARIARIKWTRQEIEGYLSRFQSRVSAGTPCISVIAFETDTGRGHAPTEALEMSFGAYLTVDCGGDAKQPIRIIEVTRQEACKAVGCLPVYRESKGETAREAMDKRLRLKAAVIEGARRQFPCLRKVDLSDAVADAIAVGLHAAYEWQRERLMERSAPVCRPLLGRGSRGGKVK